MNDGVAPVIVNYADLATAYRAYQAVVLALLGYAYVPPAPAGFSITSIVPALFDVAYLPGTGWPAEIVGTGFTSDLATVGGDPLSVQFQSQAGPSAWVGDTITYISSTRLGIQVNSGGSPPGDLGPYDVSFQDAGLIYLPTPLVIPGLITIINSTSGADGMNPTVFDLTAASPNPLLIPTDPTLSGLWMGSSDGVNYDTVYVWYPGDSLWHGLIVL